MPLHVLSVMICNNYRKGSCTQGKNAKCTTVNAIAAAYKVPVAESGPEALKPATPLAILPIREAATSTNPGGKHFCQTRRIVAGGTLGSESGLRKMCSQ